MSLEYIPQEWNVGIDAIDDEHQELLEILQAHLSAETKSTIADQECFDTFYNRFSALLAQKETHMEEVGFTRLNNSKKQHAKTLAYLMDIQKAKALNLFDACKNTLFREIANTELYHSHYV